MASLVLETPWADVIAPTGILLGLPLATVYEPTTLEVILTSNVQVLLGATVAPVRVTELAVVAAEPVPPPLVRQVPPRAGVLAINTLLGRVSVNEALVKGMLRSLFLKVTVNNAVSTVEIVLGAINLLMLGLIIFLT